MERIVPSPWGKSLALLSVLCYGFVRPASAKIIYVNANATGTVRDGKTWATAFTAVLPAVDVSSNGDEVWVAGGIYVGGIYLNGGVGHYGGFAGTETARYQRDWRKHPTIIDEASVYGVTAASPNSALDGFTIRGGYGISMNPGGIIRNCVLVDNFRGVSSNGVSASGATINISNCTISDSLSGGVYAQNGSSVVITNCTITANTQSAVTADASTVSITNSIIAHNLYGVSQSSGGKVALSHCDVFGNSPGDFVGIADPTGTDGNISVDPILTNPYHGVHLMATSPCIDAGIDSAVQQGSTDIDGQPRIQGVRVDMGSDEWDGLPTSQYVPVIYHVSQAGTDSADGLTWSTAKKTIGAGLTAAQGSDEVWVATGRYVENIRIKPGAGLYGGFAGTEASRDHRDSKAHLTALYALQQVEVNLTGQNGVVDGFTIYGASVRNWATSTIANCSLVGAAIVTTGEARIANCDISGNSGYGISLAGGSADVSNCTFSGNLTYGVTVSSGQLSVARCEFSGGLTAGVYVGGSGGMATITACKFGGRWYGIYVFSGAGAISDCDIRGNAAGGIGVGTTGSAVVKNCSIVGNGNGVMDSGTATITNCVVAFNRIAIVVHYGGLAMSHSNVYGSTTTDYFEIPDQTGVNGNISADPMFVNRFAGDYHLRLRSPCINAGDDAVVTPGETDLDGMPRIQRAHVDMGCYEFGTLGKPTPVEISGPLKNL